jgi:hypothetical protein
MPASLGRGDLLTARGPRTTSILGAGTRQGCYEKTIPIEGVPEALADWAANPGRTSKIRVGVS